MKPTTLRIIDVKLCIINADYEYVSISRFAALEVTLWLEEDGDTKITLPNA